MADPLVHQSKADFPLLDRGIPQRCCSVNESFGCQSWHACHCQLCYIKLIGSERSEDPAHLSLPCAKWMKLLSLEFFIHCALSTHSSLSHLFQMPSSCAASRGLFIKKETSDWVLMTVSFTQVSLLSEWPHIWLQWNSEMDIGARVMASQLVIIIVAGLLCAIWIGSTDARGECISLFSIFCNDIRWGSRQLDSCIIDSFKMLNSQEIHLDIWNVNHQLTISNYFEIISFFGFLIHCIA